MYAAAWNVKDLDEAVDKFNKKVADIVTYSWDQDGQFTLFAAGKGNWRKDVFHAYKGHRKTKEPTEKQIAEANMRFAIYDHLRENKLAIFSDNCEADDLARRKAVHMMNRGQPYIVASADKDLDMIIGPHIRFNQTMQMERYDIDEEASDYNYFKQVMVGDMGDNIRSPHLLGEKTAEKLLNETPRDKWRTMVENEYKTRCGTEWKHALYFTGSLIHIQRWKDDMFNWNKEGTWWDLGFESYPSCYKYTKAQLGEE